MVALFLFGKGYDGSPHLDRLPDDMHDSPVKGFCIPALLEIKIRTIV